MHSGENFHKFLRVALNHLYNRDILRASPLIQTFDLSNRSDPALALQRIISDAIDAFKPPTGTSLLSEKRRIYEILMYRYIEQFGQEEVAHNIDVSIRQFRREQDNAIEALRYYLWDKYQLDEYTSVQPALIDEAAKASESQLANNWDWIQRPNGEWVSNPVNAIENAINLMHPVASQYGIEVTFFTENSMPDLAVHPIAFRQILLNLIRMAIDQASSGNLHLEMHSHHSTVAIHSIVHPSKHLSLNVHAGENNLLDITAQIIAACNGKLEISTTDVTWLAIVTLPAVYGIHVLVVDDNKDIIDLLKRYSAGSRYHITGIGNPEEAITQAISIGAQIVILDVMMPYIDGWELLGRFRQHPQTAKIPLIVLSILAQKELAISLGAKALMVKPIKQETFLMTLDQVSSEFLPG